MFAIGEVTAAAIRTVFVQEGELPAVLELRRRFPIIADNEHARACVRTIAGWTPLPTAPQPVKRRRPAKGRQNVE